MGCGWLCSWGGFCMLCFGDWIFVDNYSLLLCCKRMLSNSVIELDLVFRKLFNSSGEIEWRVCE